MNIKMTLAAVALAFAPLAAFAGDTPSKSCLNNIVFSQEFLAKYPNAGKACREVMVKDGKKYARFEATVVNVKGNEVTADFTDTYKNTITTVTFSTTPDARVQMEGQEVKIKDLKAGDTLSFWVPESRGGFYAAPGAAESKKLAVVKSTPAER